MFPSAKRTSLCGSRPPNSSQEPLPATACSPTAAARSPARSATFKPKPARGDTAITSKRWDAGLPRASPPRRAAGWPAAWITPGMLFPGTSSPSSPRHQLPPCSGQSDAGEPLADLLLAWPCSAAKCPRAQTAKGGIKENKIKAMSQNLELHLSVFATGGTGLPEAGGAGSRASADTEPREDGIGGRRGPERGSLPGARPGWSLLLLLQPFPPSLPHPRRWDQPFHFSTLFCTVSGGLSADLLQM